MNDTQFTSQKIIEFDRFLSNVDLSVPDEFKIINPFCGDSKDKVDQIIEIFYHKFYDDNKKRRMILGSSPARRGTAITGIPYEDAQHLQNQTGIFIDDFYVNKSSSSFLYDVIDMYGGTDKFYSDFYMNFICPLGIVKINSKGREVNCNYYEDKKLQETLYDFIIQTLKMQMEFNIDRSICYCIGSGENYEFLKKINEKYCFFDKIIPLEHPRFIMQYNSKNKEYYLNKYLNALTKNEEENKSYERKK